MDTRVAYTGSTPGADSSTYTLFSTSACGMGGMLQVFGIRRVCIALNHSHVGVVNAYKSQDGSTWTKVTREVMLAPSSGGRYLQWDVQPYKHFKVEWVNGGSAQTTWSVDASMSVLAERGPEMSFIGITGFDATNIIGTAAGGGYRGNTAGFTKFVMCQIDSGVVGAQVRSYLDGTGKGDYLYQPAVGTIAWRAGNAAGDAFVESPVATITPYLGKIQVFALRHTGVNGVVDLWASKTSVRGGTNTTGFTQPSAALRECIGTRSNGTAFHTGLTVYGWSNYDSVLTDAQMEAVYDYVYRYGRLPKANTHSYYHVADDVASASAPSTYDDQIGSQNYTMVTGAASGIALSARRGSPEEVFAWDPADYPQRDVWLAYGDSMCAGRGNMVDAPDGYEPAAGLYMVKVAATGIVTLNEPCGDGVDDTAGVGPVGLFGWLWKNETGRETIVVNAGVGSSRTEQWVPGQANYTTALAKFVTAAALTNATIRGIIVYIGPNDAAQVLEPDWLGNTQLTLAGIRTRFGLTAAQCPAIIFQLPAVVPSDTSYTWNAEVKADIAAIADANHIVVQATTATREAYNLHHTAAENYVNAQAALAAYLAAF